MKLKFLATILGAGVLATTVAQAQTAATLQLNINGTPDRTLTLDSFSFSAGTLTIEATEFDSGSGGGGSTPIEVTNLLSVTQPSNGQIVFHTTTTFGTAGQVVPASLNISYMSNDTVPTIPLRLVPASGYEIGSWSGNICNGSTGQTCNVTMNQARNLTASFNVIPVSGSCGSAPSGTVIKSALGTSQVNVPSNTTAPNQVHAYPFNSGASGNSGVITVTRVNLGEGKTVVISECPGRVDQPVTSKCINWNNESTYQQFVTTTGSSRTNCALLPNKTYYINVKNSRGDSGSPLSTPLCTTTCGYYIYKP